MDTGGKEIHSYAVFCITGKVMLTESWLPRVSPPPTDWEKIAEAVEFVGYPSEKLLCYLIELSV